MHRSISLRRIVQSCLIVMALLLSACSWVGPKRIGVPPDFTSRGLPARLLDASSRASAYRELFPAAPYVNLRGRLDVRGKWWQGSGHSMLSLFGLVPGRAPLQPQTLAAAQTLRMRAFLTSGQTIFDLGVAQGAMTAIVYGQGAGLYFKGPIGAEGSPFAAHYGVEPWDLLPVFTIGERLAREPGTPGAMVADSSEPLRLVQAFGGGADAQTPDEVWLDVYSGLPRAATWTRSGRSWTVHYLAWLEFTDDPSFDTTAPRAPLTRLMPSEVEVVREDPYTKMHLTIDRYLFKSAVPASLANLPAPPGAQQLPLDRLGEVLP